MKLSAESLQKSVTFLPENLKIMYVSSKSKRDSLKRDMRIIFRTEFMPVHS
jgi:hypothetical protein